MLAVNVHARGDLDDDLRYARQQRVDTSGVSQRVSQSAAGLLVRALCVSVTSHAPAAILVPGRRGLWAASLDRADAKVPVVDGRIVARWRLT